MCQSPPNTQRLLLFFFCFFFFQGWCGLHPSPPPLHEKILDLPLKTASNSAWTNQVLTRSIRDSETSIDFVQGPPGSRRERVKACANMEVQKSVHPSVGVSL